MGGATLEGRPEERSVVKHGHLLRLFEPCSCICFIFILPSSSIFFVNHKTLCKRSHRSCCQWASARWLTEADSGPTIWLLRLSDLLLTKRLIGARPPVLQIQGFALPTKQAKGKSVCVLPRNRLNHCYRLCQFEPAIIDVQTSERDRLRCRSGVRPAMVTSPAHTLARPSARQSKGRAVPLTHPSWHSLHGLLECSRH